MSVLTRFIELKIYSIIFLSLLFAHSNDAWDGETADWYILESMKNLMITGTDIVKSTYELIESVEYIKQRNLNKPAFETGYLMFTTFEVYRKMIDKYNTSAFMINQLYHMEILLYLNDIENHYWELDHISSMLHEIDRKYNVSSGVHSKYHEITSAEIHAKEAEERDRMNPYSPETKKRLKIRQKMRDKLIPTKRTKKPGRFPFDYGWDYP